MIFCNIGKYKSITQNRYTKNSTYFDSCLWAAFETQIADRRENETVFVRKQNETAAAVLEVTTLQYVNCDFLAEEPFAFAEYTLRQQQKIM